MNQKVKGGLSEGISAVLSLRADAHWEEMHFRQVECSYVWWILMLGLILLSLSFLMWTRKGKRVLNINANMLSLSAEQGDVWWVIYSGGRDVMASVLVLLEYTAINQLTHCTAEIAVVTAALGHPFSFLFIDCINYKCCCAERLFYQHANTKAL